MPQNVYAKFGREDESIPIYWWLSTEKSEALNAAMDAGKELPIESADVRYQEVKNAE